MEAGRRLGPYEVVSRIGAGGMGEVWRARDTRLGREVAIKILPDEFASDPGRRSRLQREAKVISRLNHPHICSLYDVGSENGTDYLVIEYLQGQSLADRMIRGSVPIREALSIGIAIAEALDRAHREGITHRDVKPANIVLTKSGAKLLDFGIARDVTRTEGAETTTAQKLTGDGALIGSVPYMSPEQAEGRAADARSDIFALGAVLYEMIAGRPPFAGDTHAALIAAIVGSEPAPLRSVQPLASRELEHVVAKCLEKNPERRWQSAWDLAEELRFIAETKSEDARQVANVRRWKLAATLTALIAVVLAAILVIAPRYRRRPDPVRLYFRTPPEVWISNPNRRPLAVSPDGNHIAFVAGNEAPLWLESFTSAGLTRINGTNYATSPFWSPDGRFIAYYQEHQLKRIAVEGGTPRVVAAGESLNGSAWSRNGTMLLAKADGLYTVSAEGGVPRRILAASNVKYFDPVFLADGEHYLVTQVDRERNGTILLHRLGDSSQRVILRDATSAMWTSTGHLLFVRGGKLMAQRFDPRRFQTSGEPVVLTDSIWLHPNGGGGAMYSVSRDGRMLAFHPNVAQQKLVRVDFHGDKVADLTTPADLSFPAVSHDGKTVAYGDHKPNGDADLWTLDLGRGVASRLTTTVDLERIPVWSPDDRQIAYSSDSGMCVIPASGGAPRVVAGDSLGAIPTSWSPDGKTILMTQGDDITAVRLSDGTIEPIVQSHFSERWGRFSPDGRWITYESDESGTEEIYVQRFPDGAFKTRVSNAGGTTPIWSRDGSKIYYYFPFIGFKAVDVVVGSEGVRAALPRPMFETTPSQLTHSFSETGDGRGVIGIQRVAESRFGGLEILVNWTSLVP